jgi:hypothetical protein
VADALSRRLHGAEELSWISIATPHWLLFVQSSYASDQVAKELLSCNYRVLLFPILHSEMAY